MIFIMKNLEIILRWHFPQVLGQALATWRLFKVTAGLLQYWVKLPQLLYKS